MKTQKIGKYDDGIILTGRSWFEVHRCAYTNNGKQCGMLGTSSAHIGPESRYHCAYHKDLLKEESRRTFHGKGKGDFGFNHFHEWYIEHIKHLSTRDQFCKDPEDDMDDINYKVEYDERTAKRCWIKVSCGRGLD